MALNGSPAIGPVAADEHRPFWSVMIPTYNPRAEFFVQTLDAVLAQDPGPAEMEIAVIDDCSGEDVRELAHDAARERVAWHRQDRHVGIGRNWNTCIHRARGHWVHILHQDDLVLPGFYDRLRGGVESSAAIGAAFCRDIVIDAQGEQLLSQPLLRTTPGIVEDWIQRVFIGLELRASALVVRRSAYEALGGFRLDFQYALDWDMWKRIAAAYPLWYEPAPLARYRRHTASASAEFVRSGANIAEIRRSIELSGAALDPELAAMVSKQARQTYTRYAVLTAWRALRAHEYGASIAQVREARKLSSTLSVLLAIGKFLPRARRVR